MVIASRKERAMFKKVLIRGFIVVAVVATGGVAVAAVQGRSASSPPQPAAVVAARTTFVTSEASVRTALLSACGGRALVAALSTGQEDRVDHMLGERALHAAGLAGNPLNTGTGFQAGVDDALHVQALDRELATMLCP
jgi:hypothetical protein